MNSLIVTPLTCQVYIYPLYKLLVFLCCHLCPRLCHSLLTPSLSISINTTGSPAGAICERVRGHAASAMINLINPDTCDADALKDHLEPLLSALVVCLQTASVGG